MPTPLAYTKCDVQLIKVAPDDGLIQSETCRTSNGKQSLITRILYILLVYMHITKYTLHNCVIMTIETAIYLMLSEKTAKQFIFISLL